MSQSQRLVLCFEENYTVARIHSKNEESSEVESSDDEDDYENKSSDSDPTHAPEQRNTKDSQIFIYCTFDEHNAKLFQVCGQRVYVPKTGILHNPYHFKCPTISGVCEFILHAIGTRNTTSMLMYAVDMQPDVMLTHKELSESTNPANLIYAYDNITINRKDLERDLLMLQSFNI